MSETIEVIKNFQRPGSTGVVRFFGRGERYEAIGEKYTVREQCPTCTGVRMMDVSYWNIEVEGVRYAVRADYMTIMNPGSPQGTVFFDPTDRLNQVTGGDMGLPDNYHPKEELAKFNALGVIDLRRSKRTYGSGDTGRTDI